jgi:prevent-host-death family protein
MPVIVGAFEAKTHFSELLARAAGGETIVVSKHGAPVAKLVPLSQSAPGPDAARAFAEIVAARPNIRLGGAESKALKQDGRR